MTVTKRYTFREKFSWSLYDWANSVFATIVLAGFLLKLGPDWIRTFPDKIINIHPALLPKYGGKGMFGNYVHQAVKNNKEKETGITIHYVNEEFDKGKILFQKKIKIDLDDTIDEIASLYRKKLFPKGAIDYFGNRFGYGINLMDWYFKYVLKKSHMSIIENRLEKLEKSLDKSA